jgi:ankyrin repeat protein
MKRNVLTAAIIGKQDYIVQAILERNFYSLPNNEKYIDKLYRGYDKLNRTPMHYAYLNNDDSIIQLLKEAGFEKNKKRDNNGFHPEQARHKHYALNSDSEISEEEVTDDSNGSDNEDIGGGGDEEQARPMSTGAKEKHRSSYDRKYRLHLMAKRPSYCFIIERNSIKLFEKKL